MAVTIVSNTDAELSGKYVGEARVKTVTFSRTDAQIKALPSGVYEIKAAVANRLFVPLWAILIGDFSAGAYTNINAGAISNVPYVGIATNNEVIGGEMSYVINIADEGIIDLTTFFGTASKQRAFLSMYHKLSGMLGEVIVPVYNLTNTVGNIVLAVNNSGDGNFTGGNAANTLTGTVGYLEVVV